MQAEDRKQVLTLLQWKAFGQIQVLAEFESSIFDEVSDWEMIFQIYKVSSALFPCTSQCIGFNWRLYLRKQAQRSEG